MVSLDFPFLLIVNLIVSYKSSTNDQNIIITEKHNFNHSTYEQSHRIKHRNESTFNNIVYFHKTAICHYVIITYLTNFIS